MGAFPWRLSLGLLSSCQVTVLCRLDLTLTKWLVKNDKCKCTWHMISLRQQRYRGFYYIFLYIFKQVSVAFQYNYAVIMFASEYFPSDQWGLVTPYGVIKLGQLWFKCLTTPSHYLNQYWLISCALSIRSLGVYQPLGNARLRSLLG